MGARDLVGWGALLWGPGTWGPGVWGPGIWGPGPYFLGPHVWCHFGSPCGAVLGAHPGLCAQPELAYHLGQGL